MRDTPRHDLELDEKMIRASEPTEIHVLPCKFLNHRRPALQRVLGLSPTSSSPRVTTTGGDNDVLKLTAQLVYISPRADAVCMWVNDDAQRSTTPTKLARIDASMTCGARFVGVTYLRC